MAAPQSKTLDWTATGPSKTDFICVGLSGQGLRLRHLNRTQRNRALPWAYAPIGKGFILVSIKPFTLA